MFNKERGANPLSQNNKIMKYAKRQKTQITKLIKDEGISIEETIRNSINNPKGIEMTASPIYTERSQGILPEYDIRTDKQLIAIEASEKYHKSEYMQSEFPTYKEYQKAKAAEIKATQQQEQKTE